MLGHLKPGRSRGGPSSFSTRLGSLSNISTLVASGGAEAQRYLIAGVWTFFPLLRGSSQYIRQPVLVWVPGSSRELELELSPSLGGDLRKGRKPWMRGSRGTYSSTPLNCWLRAAGSRVGIILSITQLGKEKLCWLWTLRGQGLRRCTEGDPSVCPGPDHVEQALGALRGKAHYGLHARSWNQIPLARQPVARQWLRKA